MIETATTVALIGKAVQNVERSKKDSLHGRRELQLTVTKLEEAQMWYTRGRAKDLGMFNPVDLDEVKRTAEQATTLLGENELD